jgi:toxin ParE1/3/4
MKWGLSPEAFADLQEIWAYIAKDNPDAADRLRTDIRQGCERLAKNPGIGQPRPKLTSQPVRFWLVRGNWWIIYEVGDNTLRVIRILHAARDVGAQL